MRPPSSIQPRFARIAAAIGDPTRCRMLAALIDGAALPVQGRHRCYRVHDADVAQALEALSIVAERTSAGDKWLREPYRSLKFARTCYRHIAGEFGVQLLQALLADGRLAAGGEGYQLTAAGHSWLRDIGMEVPARSERYAFACLDWSERRYHLAGRLATALLEHFIARLWLARVPRSRALRLTPAGRRGLTLPELSAAAR